MNPDEPENEAQEQPREEDRAGEHDHAEETAHAPAPYAPPQNMYARGVDDADVARPDAEVAEGEPEDGEYVDAELEQYETTLTHAYESSGAEDGAGDDDGAHVGDANEEDESDRGEADETLESEGPIETVAYEASDAGGGQDPDEVEHDDDDDDDDDDGDDDDDEEGEDDNEEDREDDYEDDEGSLRGEDDLHGLPGVDREEPAQALYAEVAVEEADHTAAFAQLTDEADAPGSLYEPPPTPTPAPRPARQQRAAPVRERRPIAPAQDDDGFLFGAPDIPMPPPKRRIDKQRARDARANLDLDLGRIKRIKRFGLVITTLTVLFVAFVLAPVTWVGAYLFFDPPVNVLMMQRAAEGQTIRHQPVPINRMSPHIVRAVIAAEDARFCTHDGFDVEAIQRAMQANARGGRTRGASTISQQTAKNLFLWPDRSWLRKGLETYFTALVEFMWPKRRIMEAYLNTAEWGDGVFGVEAAARARFGVSAADLTPLQAARLAAVLPNPNRWRADAPGPYVRQRSAALVGRARVVRDERMAACVLNLDRPG